MAGRKGLTCLTKLGMYKIEQDYIHYIYIYIHYKTVAVAIIYGREITEMYLAKFFKMWHLQKRKFSLINSTHFLKVVTFDKIKQKRPRYPE